MLQGELRRCKNQKEIESIQVKLDKLAKVESKPLAFASKADQERFMMASSYDDEWVSIENADGSKDWFRMFYICQSGGQWRCVTITSSKSWTRRHKDPLATKQRWKCVVCGARYRVAFGTLIEVSRKGITYFMRASIPDNDVQDVRALFHEKRFNPKAAEELFNILPVLHPSTGFALQPIVGHADSFNLSAAQYDELPAFNWSDLLALVRNM
jgi:hypothetical protein